MRTVEISDEVWAELVKRGKFGETADDVFRREFQLPQRVAPAGTYNVPTRTDQSRASGSSKERRPRFATTRMSAYVRERMLVVEFAGGSHRTFHLAEPGDKVALKRVREDATAFVRQNGGSYGQEMAVKKALTEAGYHLMK